MLKWQNPKPWDLLLKLCEETGGHPRLQSSQQCRVVMYLASNTKIVDVKGRKQFIRLKCCTLPAEKQVVHR